MKEILKVAVTGATGNLGYAIMGMLGRGAVFGVTQPIQLNLFDVEPQKEVLEAVKMEIDDCALPLVKKIVPTSDLSVAFKDIKAAFLIGSVPRGKGMERKDLLAKNVKIFKEQGEALDKHANKEVRVLVVGNPANTNAWVCSEYAPSIARKNFSAMTRLDQNRATYQIAKKLGVPPSEVRNVFIFGGVTKPIVDCVDEEWLNCEFIETVAKRGAAVIEKRKLSSAMSAANAACDHMRDWWHGTEAGEVVSMAVYADGTYCSAKETFFSFPVTIDDKKEWTILPGLEMSYDTKSKIFKTSRELKAEKEEAMAALCEGPDCKKKEEKEKKRDLCEQPKKADDKKPKAEAKKADDKKPKAEAAKKPADKPKAPEKPKK
uniref:Malate dehydrogenase n=1 Tax=Megaselia scalaris TaxID=36166 RepID=T1GRD3_MEGSC